MSTLKDFSQVEHILQEIDRLITEMSSLRSQVAALSTSATGPYQVVDKFEGLWADYAISEADIAAARQELWATLDVKTYEPIRH